jgi:hypothetical protein
VSYSELVFAVIGLLCVGGAAAYLVMYWAIRWIDGHDRRKAGRQALALFDADIAALRRKHNLDERFRPLP